MALNIEVNFSETAEASALVPMEITIVNSDSLPCAFKLNLLHPHRYITNVSHGIIMAKRSKTILLRLRAPHDLKKDGHSPVPSILKPSSGGKGPRSRSPGGDAGGAGSSPQAAPGSPVGAAASTTVETTEIARLDVRVMTALIADPATEADFQRYWPTAFHHSKHTIPFTAIFLSEEEFFSALMKKQEALLSEAESERAAVQRSVDALNAQLKNIVEQNQQFTKDLGTIRKRAELASRRRCQAQDRITVPTVVGLLAVVASMVSAASIALSIS